MPLHAQTTAMVVLVSCNATLQVSKDFTLEGLQLIRHSIRTKDVAHDKGKTFAYVSVLGIVK